MKKIHGFFVLMVFLLALLYPVPPASTVLPIEAKEKTTSSVRLIPGGHSIGVKLNTAGVIVVGYHFLDQNGSRISPGEMAKIKIGDVITHVNKQKVVKMHDVRQFVNEAGESGVPVMMTLQRDRETLHVKIKPVKDEKNDGFRIGLFVRDSATGIGTLTFIDPQTKKYGALGHVITDIDTKKAVKIKDGQLLFSTVTAIEKGQQGKAGEKLAELSMRDVKIGSIEKNSPYGIFGKLEYPTEQPLFQESLPISTPKEGKATMLTVIEGEKVEAFEIEITNVTHQKVPNPKGMVLKITDERLLEKTGGIIQGMSGSPIIQNGHIVGAVTHVFVNDPSSGYGVQIEWMLRETQEEKEIIQRKAG
ncbi:SpoIVB peptidase [Massilibacterium senegalense]|uniref:SpoIVB peptidase n=1 Tax=Massilibacterium senegalense TaxID=1632858 RepID=UPI000784C314|nr:SpoIVB peptidase [Massilibacterium senegalense]